MIAVNSSAPLIFGDRESAARTLAPLKAETRVAEGAIYAPAAGDSPLSCARASATSASGAKHNRRRPL